MLRINGSLVVSLSLIKPYNVVAFMFVAIPAVYCLVASRASDTTSHSSVLLTSEKKPTEKIKSTTQTAAKILSSLFVIFSSPHHIAENFPVRSFHLAKMYQSRSINSIMTTAPK